MWRSNSGRFRENLGKAVVDHTLRRRVAGPVGAGAIGEQQPHAFLCVFCQPPDIGELAVYRRVVELEVTGVHHQADGGMDCHAHAVGNAVAHVEELEAEGSQSNLIAGGDLMQLNLLFQAVLFELDLHQSEGEPRAIDGSIDLA